MDPDVRVASASDVPTLARLRWQMHVEEVGRQIAEEQFVDRFTAWAGLALDNGRWRVWVAVVDGRLVGHVYLERVDKVPRPVSRPAAWGYLTAFYVEKPFRDRGVGQHLLRAAIDWAISVGLEFVQGWPSKRSIALYERMGFGREDEAFVLHLNP